jgi:hypothetical protein
MVRATDRSRLVSAEQELAGGGGDADEDGEQE